MRGHNENLSGLDHLSSKPRDKKSSQAEAWELCKKTGNTYFHAFGTIIGPECLTSEFGKGSGGTTPVCSPEMICRAYSPRQIQLCVVDEMQLKKPLAVF